MISIFSSSVESGYQASFNTASVAYHKTINNIHIDSCNNGERGMQSPFTEDNVGGYIHRHQALNAGSDDAGNRAEGFRVFNARGAIFCLDPPKPDDFSRRDFMIYIDEEVFSVIEATSTRETMASLFYDIDAAGYLAVVHTGTVKNSYVPDGAGGLQYGAYWALIVNPKKSDGSLLENISCNENMRILLPGIYEVTPRMHAPSSDVMEATTNVSGGWGSLEQIYDYPVALTKYRQETVKRPVNIRNIKVNVG